MPNSLVIYMVAHQPRRIRLPSQLIPRGTPPEKMDALIFDDQMDRRYFDKVAKYCYRPATELFQSLVEKGMKISLGFSVSLLVQMRRFGPDLRAGVLAVAGRPRDGRAGGGRALSLLHLLSRHRGLRRTDGLGQAAARGDLP